MNPNDIDDTLDGLRRHGYMASSLETPDGIPLVQIDGSRQEYLVTDFQTDERRYFRAPTVCVAVLEFTVERESPLATKFAAELVKLLAPADRLSKKHNRPLVRTTLTSVQAIYQTQTSNVTLTDDSLPYYPQLWPHGLAFPDASPYSTAELMAACGTVRMDGSWLNDETPLTRPCGSLPAWNGEAMATKLQILVARFVAAGELRVREAYKAPPLRELAGDTSGHLAGLRRAGVSVDYTNDDVPPVLVYADPRLAAAFAPDLSAESTQGSRWRDRG